jgi:phosphopantothenoylcysteine synthetase/decarboxylase
MKVLVTSGGTKIKIDMVRSITNMSKGTFGAKIAEAFLLQDSELDVVFLHAKGSRLPFDEADDYFEKYSKSVEFVEYETFTDYQDRLDEQLKLQPDIVVLAAAVSDYGVANYVSGKIRSKESMTIELTPLPKLISTVRDTCPTAVICGFKLLVNSTQGELLVAGMESLFKNRLDLVVGNDLRDIKANNHKLTIIEGTTSDWKATVYKKHEHSLPNVVVNKCFEHLHIERCSEL